MRDEDMLGSINSLVDEERALLHAAEHGGLERRDASDCTRSRSSLTSAGTCYVSAGRNASLA